MSSYSNETVAERLREAANLLKAGNKAAAKPLIASILKEDSRHAHAWYLAAYVYDDPERKIKALETALGINPNHAEARKALMKLRPGDELDDLLDSVPERNIQYAPQKRKVQDSYYDHAVMVAQNKDYSTSALMVFILYLFFWLPGVIVNLWYLNDAKQNERLAGYHLPGVTGLRVLWFIFGFIPLLLFGVYIVIAIVF